ncbi:MAG TPA: ribosome small subunit-dependent GTPase A [Phycisphaerae bacterium]|nr:ribosome small subunit-dependent GTPase A [Phycisphaerae bacterium]
MLTDLNAYGWNSHFHAQLAPDEPLTSVARVVQEHKEAYLVHVPAAGVLNVWAEISGKLRHSATVRSDFPAVGDWVIVRGMRAAPPTSAPPAASAGPLQISRILPRHTVISRRLDGKREGGGAGGDEQLLAVNVDVAFLGSSLNDNFNLRRLERYLALAHDAGVPPVVLLTKADLCQDPGPFIEQVRSIAPAAAVHAISVLTGAGLEHVRAQLTPGRTAVILGSSGVGKSTLVNHLADADVQDMMETREFDDKGRHCTTFRNLVRTPTGGLIIDTPGLRGLSLGEASDALAATFADIEALAATCKFTDCRHDSEPGCAIKAALEAGTIDAARFDSYLRLQRELAAMSRRENRIIDRKQKKLDKKLSAAADKKEKRKWDHFR